MTPTLASRYRVELFKGTKLLATSVTRTVYVVTGGTVKGGAKCGRPVCHEQFVIDEFMPASALTYEMSKPVYPYFGLTLGAINLPPPPKVLLLGGGNASVTKPKRISAGELEVKISYSLTIGNHSYYWLWGACTKDAVTKDGLGLPGSHGRGAKQGFRMAGPVSAGGSGGYTVGPGLGYGGSGVRCFGVRCPQCPLRPMSPPSLSRLR